MRAGSNLTASSADAGVPVMITAAAATQVKTVNGRIQNLPCNVRLIVVVSLSIRLGCIMPMLTSYASAQESVYASLEGDCRREANGVKAQLQPLGEALDCRFRGHVVQALDDGIRFA